MGRKAGEAPLGGATVRIKGFDGTASTDSNGYFRIEVLSAGTYSLYVTCSGFSVIERQCSVSSGGTASLGALTASVNTSPQIAFLEPDSAREGGPVKICGINFGESSQVSFNGREASAYWHRGEDQIVCTVPAGATSGMVTVGGNTAGRYISILPAGDLAVSDQYVPAESSDIPVTVRLERDLKGLNGLAFFLKYDASRLSLASSVGTGGVELDPALGGALLMVKPGSSGSSGVLGIGLTLKGSVLNGKRRILTVHFKPVASPAQGALGRVEMDSSRKRPRACLKNEGQPIMVELSSNPGYVVFRREDKN
jgi:hypothetical protein